MALTIEDIKAKLEIIFKQRVANIVKIGAKGAVLFATKDAAQTEVALVKEFKSALNITGVSDAIKEQIKTIFAGGTSKVILVTYKTTFESAVDTLKIQRFNWLVCDQASDQADVVTYAKENKCFAVVYNQLADSMFVVNFRNPTVTLADDTTKTGVAYLPRIAGSLAGLPYTQSASSITYTDLKNVTLPADIAFGQYILNNEEDGVKVAAPVNSLLTLTTNVTESMKSICIVEAMKRIDQDIKYAYITGYKGFYKNHYNNQCLFYSAVNGYYKKLVGLELLDPLHKNVCGTDVQAQRDAWLEIGKDEAETWTDLEVKYNTFGNSVFALSDVKILDAMESLKFTVEMF